MRLAGFLLLLAGWGIVLTAVVVLAGDPARLCFVLAGVGVEIVGITLVFRSYPLVIGKRS